MFKTIIHNLFQNIHKLQHHVPIKYHMHTVTDTLTHICSEVNLRRRKHKKERVV